MSTRLIRIYTGNQFNGYIFELTNITKHQKLFINVQNLAIGDPNVAILSAVDQAVVEPGSTERSKTYLRIVAKPSSIYNQLILPIQTVDKKEGT